MSKIPVFTAVRIIPREDDFLDRKVGSRGEIFYNRDTNSLQLYDGINKGGIALAKSDLSNISNSDFLNKATAAGVGIGGGGNVTVSISDSVPTSPSNGNLWLNTNNGILYVYVNDGDSQQWIQPASPIPNLENYALLSSLSAVATSGSYDDLSNKPNLENYALLSSLSAVATSGSYDELSNKPSIPTALTDLGITDGTLGQILTTDGSGNFTFQDPTGGNIADFIFVGSNIDTDDSSGISITPTLTLESDLIVENETVIRNSLTVQKNIVAVDFLLQGEFSSQGSGVPELSSDNEILLTAGTRVELTNSPIKMCSFTTAGRDNLIPENGDVIYNTTTNKFQGYANSTWVDLH
jgi:hypothetical protein